MITRTLGTDLTGSTIGLGCPRPLATADPVHTPAVLDLVRQFAAVRGCTSGQIARVWPLAQRPWIVPIPGTRTPGPLRENSTAAQVVLTCDPVAQPARESAAIAIEARRFPGWLQAHPRLSAVPVLPGRLRAGLRQAAAVISRPGGPPARR